MQNSSAFQKGNPRKRVFVEQFKLWEISKSATSTDAAFATDPGFAYISPGLKKPGCVSKFIWMNVFLQAFVTAMAFTVNKGDAIAVINLPGMDKDPKGRSRLTYWILTLSEYLLKGINELSSKEAKKRRNEVESKMQKMIAESLGESVKEMIYITVLATAPECQGLGYGTALVNTITLSADGQGRSTYLISSNTNNTGFYNSCGFSAVNEVLIGDNNPNYDGKPFLMTLMVRRPRNVLSF